ncbi:MAG TPA: precorrin-6A reductase [Methanothermococcus okinawensis]|uniref:Precorrin-6A reductase n=1 Tax=Methanothermococcus okinawensis TaxID=155863 RepID=A0A832YTL1_9EURY|nr:precorrin-6A reductase [Methanothermococcus okinawensis]
MKSNISINKNILIMGGTRDGILIAKELKKIGGIYIITTTTTNYGSELAKKYSDMAISMENTPKTLKDIVKEYDISLLIDATHPFAINASKRALSISRECNIKYIRYERPQKRYNNAIYVKDFKEASKIALKIGKKNILYLAGIKNLNTVAGIVGKNRLIARVLPISVNKALEILPSKNILGMEGVFSREFNKILILEYNCDVIITKDSGDSGGLNEKVLGAMDADAKIIIVERPKMEYPILFNSIEELVDYTENLIYKEKMVNT